MHGTFGLGDRASIRPRDESMAGMSEGRWTSKAEYDREQSAVFGELYEPDPGLSRNASSFFPPPNHSTPRASQAPRKLPPAHAGSFASYLNVEPSGYMSTPAQVRPHPPPGAARSNGSLNSTFRDAETLQVPERHQAPRRTRSQGSLSSPGSARSTSSNGAKPVETRQRRSSIASTLTDQLHNLVRRASKPELPRESLKPMRRQSKRAEASGPVPQNKQRAGEVKSRDKGTERRHSKDDKHSKEPPKREATRNEQKKQKKRPRALSVDDIDVSYFDQMIQRRGSHLRSLRYTKGTMAIQKKRSFNTLSQRGWM